MGWVRVDDAFYDHEKFQAAGPLGVAQWIAGLAWANRNLSDGFIPASASRRLLDWEGVAWRMWSGDLVGGGEDAESDEVSEHLVECCLWEKVTGGYLIHDYHDYQPTAEKIKADRSNNAARQAAWRAANAEGNGSRNGVTNETVTGAPNPTPNPTSKPKKETSKAAARKRAGRSRKIDDDLKPLSDALSAVGITVTWDTDAEGLGLIRGALARCGVSELVKHAQRRHQPNNPAFSVRAFIEGWNLIPAKATRFELVPDPCEHGYDHPSRCPMGCRELAVS